MIRQRLIDFAGRKVPWTFDRIFPIIIVAGIFCFEYPTFIWLTLVKLFTNVKIFLDFQKHLTLRFTDLNPAQDHRVFNCHRISLFHYLDDAFLL